MFLPRGTLRYNDFSIKQRVWFRFLYTGISYAIRIHEIEIIIDLSTGPSHENITCISIRTIYYARNKNFLQILILPMYWKNGILLYKNISDLPYTTESNTMVKVDIKRLYHKWQSLYSKLNNIAFGFEKKRYSVSIYSYKNRLVHICCISSIDLLVFWFQRKYRIHVF